MLLLPIVLAFAGGALLPVFRQKKTRNAACITVVLAVTALAWLCLLTPDRGSQEILRLTDTLVLTLRLDGLGKIFAGLISALWPLATLYGFCYMEHDRYPGLFFALYTVTYGVTLGIAFSGNLLTLYCFYELLTLCTVVLVMHGFSRKAVHAARKYLYYSLGGSAFAFIGMVFLIVYVGSTDFTYGGLFTQELFAGHKGILQVVYVLTFCGFSAKAAVFPLHAWLPDAAVAPTPVTALLHAVAVVKAGTFAIIRMTYYNFGTECLAGTWPQRVVQILVLFTVLLGSTMAVKELHVKRRMAWSTVANLSYVLLGVTLMTPEGLAAGVLHLLVHAVMKIVLFFCCGAILHRSEREYLNQMNGLGRRMPVTCACFTVAGLSLIGVPPLGGFFSKWNLAQAALSQGTFGLIGVIVLLISATLTGVYVLTVVTRFYFPSKTAPAAEGKPSEAITEPDARMLVPILLCTLVTVAMGLAVQPLMTLIHSLLAL